MSNYLKIYILLTLLISIGCEDVEVAAPGNNQSNESVAPLGAIIWDENNVILDDEKAKLPENSAPGITIGRLNATDANPDDEFLFEIIIWLLIIKQELLTLLFFITSMTNN